MPNANNLNRRQTMMKNVLGRVGAAFVSAILTFGASSALAAGNGNNGNGNGNGNNGNGGSGISGNRADNGRNKIADDLDRVLNGHASGRERWVKPSLRGQ